jgi:N-acetylmuramic acid 6-phosphate (MurNAc-6-P) etherase
MFEYLMAGHDLALIKSQEKAEDDVVQSIEDLKKVTDDDDHCDFAIYIGITCGMSAPYVGSQVDWILNSSHPSRISFITVLMGFNTEEMGRKTPIEGFPKTMHQVISELKGKIGDGRHFIINPILGPEPIAGSSRMKGGSATKLLLEMIAARVLHRAFPNLLPLSYVSEHQLPYIGHASPSSFISMIEFFERVNRWTYLREDKISRLIQMAGDSLNSGGHIYYLGEDSIAMIALIDASECPPTYGAHFSDVRAFVPGGWSTMSNIEGDMSFHGVNYQISVLDFETKVVASLTEKDLIIVLHSQNQSSELLCKLIKQAKSTCPLVKFGLVSWSIDLQHEKSLESAILNGLDESSKSFQDRYEMVPIKLPSCELLPGLMSGVEISAKWILNAISTGAHILKGKILSNRMIDLNLSNDKLYRRGIILVSSILSVSEQLAIDSILKSIHQVDELNDEIRSMPISQHYKEAVKQKQVVPVALLLASGKYQSIQACKEALSKDSILRNIIAGLVDDQKM